MSGNHNTVYVNDNPISETEVYHNRPGHVTHRRRWRDEYVREITVEAAREDGLRPCKQCYPAESGRSCPGCGYQGDGGEVLAADQRWCSNDECRVVSFGAEVAP